MNKFLYSILIAAAGFGTLNAQQKVMKIEYKDGTTVSMHTARLSQKQNTHLKTINGIATTTAKITTNGKSTTNWAQQSPGQTTTWHT